MPATDGSRAIRQLVRWYGTHKRDLPWRDINDAYFIFVSEIMLQQTQVDRVIPKFKTWVKRFPTWNALADAKTPDLLAAWAGLGYNNRALRLRDAARQVMRDGVPTDEDGWKRLPGVGTYTAAALAEFANHRYAVVIDTNVRRVAGRAFLGIVHPQPTHDSRIRRSLLTNIPRRGRHWDIPQAFMDLGASICLPMPSCATCPLKTTCLAAPKFLSGKVMRRTRTTTTEYRHAGKKHPDRIYRGRILTLIRERGPTRLSAIGPNVDTTFDAVRDNAWLETMVHRLIKDGILTMKKGGHVSLTETQTAVFARSESDERRGNLTEILRPDRSHRRIKVRLLRRGTPRNDGIQYMKTPRVTGVSSTCVAFR
ncbi:A/G-specific adenine glycosylase [Patescibacteria group bacterium]|nr:A/G-specific adenine glycosylase [Patescibacteria group bacterium]MBU1448283.1 A/G-specific adenine glycosylase [Patescibacteria group bacterium]MBU2613657.1 A/G-specific adenine glycosylase [Patescibacteria group bacterium]